MRSRILALALIGLAHACSEDRPPVEGECVSSRDCPEGQVCVGRQCAPDVDSGCKRNSDCDSGEYCEISTGMCTASMPKTTCANHSECPLDQICDPGLAICVPGLRPCGAGGECPPGSVCDAPTDRCVECLGPEHCQSPATCIENSCVDPSTPDGGMSVPHDDASTVDAGPECMSDPQCAPPQTVCEGDKCVIGCGLAGGLTCVAGREVCDTHTGRCTRLVGPCANDPDCGAPANVCETGQCVPGCGQAGGIQCVGGRICDPASGRCQMGGPICLSDMNCRAPNTICNLTTGQCDPGCGTTGCTAPATCNATTGHCVGVATCQDDSFEQNDTLATAAQLGAGIQPNLGACPADDDYYALALSGGGSATIDLSFVHGEGNIDAELRDPNGQIVAQSKSTADTEQITYAPMAAGTYTLRVFLAADMGPRPGNQYRMTVAINAPTCAADPAEPNDTQATASASRAGTYFALNVCESSDDFYSISVTAGRQLDVEIVAFITEGDIDLELLNSAGQVVASSLGVLASESLSYSVRTTGMYYVRVFLSSDLGSTEGNSYVMSLSVSTPPPPQCVDDALEQNDSDSAAKTITSGTRSNLAACSADDDYYAIALVAQDKFNLTVDFSHAEGDVDAELRDPAGNIVVSGLSSTDDELLSHTAVVSGTYGLRVYLAQDLGSTPGNTYSLVLGVAKPQTCLRDASEPNDAQASPKMLNPGTYAPLGSCSDDDYYAVSANAGSSLTVSLKFTHAEGDIDLELRNPSGTVVARGITTTDNETVTYSVTTTGTYLIRVNLFQDAGSNTGNAYSLTLSR